VSGIRVIAGRARGRKLQLVPGDSTRPITDRVKENLFNILGAGIRKASLLDLFAGTGSVGIEALSRGADFVCFVDRHPAAIRTVRDNLRTTGFEGQSQVLRADAFKLLEKEPERAYDLVFVAPPQYHEMWMQALKLLDERDGWLSEAGEVIVQIDPREDQPLSLANLEEADRRRYGNTLLLFFRRAETAVEVERGEH
jgi:16S rRNA (guanine966-N2)-methyltransferase